MPVFDITLLASIINSCIMTYIFMLTQRCAADIAIVIAIAVRMSFANPLSVSVGVGVGHRRCHIFTIKVLQLGGGNIHG